MKHLTIANASLKYMSTRISSRVNSTLEELHLEKELVTILINSYSVIKLLKKTLKQILEHANEVYTEKPLILECKN